MTDMRNERILVGTPIYHQSKPFFYEMLSTWRNLTYPNISFYWVENDTPDEDVTKMLNSIEFVRHPGDLLVSQIAYVPSSSEYGSLAQAQNAIRDYCLAHNFDFLFFNETSRPVPADILESLLSYEKRVIGALYKDTYHPGYYCVYDYDFVQDEHIMEPYLNIDGSSEASPVYGIGFGATLIHRTVLAAIKGFRSGLYAADTYFYEDLQRLGIPAFAAPIHVKNLKIDGDLLLLHEWWQAREQLLRSNQGVDSH